MTKILESLQITNTNTWRQRKALVLRAASKPAALKDLCDTVQTGRQILDQLPFSNSPEQQVRDRSSGKIQSTYSGSVTGTVCNCPRPGRFRTNKAGGIQWGHLYLSRKQETQGHWPSCPLANTGIKHSRKSTSLKFTGLASIISAAIEITISMTSGSGGYSITPNVTYYPTVDAEVDPAFCILDLLSPFFKYRTLQEDRSSFVVACARKLVRLFDEKKAYPTAVDYRNNSLLHRTASALVSNPAILFV